MFALKYGKSRDSDLLSTASSMACEYSCVYLEIGLQAGMLLIADMIQNTGK